MMRLLAAAVAGLLFAASPGNAQRIKTIRGTSPTSYMLDGQPAATGAWSLRRLLTSYSTNKLVNLRRTSDSTTTDIGFDATGAIDIATASTFCNATTCFVAKWYDQSGNTRDLLQATAASQPAFIFNCLGTSPCVRFTSSVMTLVAASNITPATGVVSFAIAAARPAGTGACGFLRENATNNVIGANGAANSWRLSATGGGGFNNGSATDGPFYSGIGVINGSSSQLYINSSVSNGTVTGNTTAGTPLMVGSPSTTCQTVTGIFWDNTALSLTQAAAITANQRAWWGF